MLMIAFCAICVYRFSVIGYRRSLAIDLRSNLADLKSARTGTAYFLFCSDGFLITSNLLPQ